MNFLDRLPFRKSEVVPENAVETGDELIRLSESDSRVADEITAYESKVAELLKQAQIGGEVTSQDRGLMRQYAVQSAQALSGYGIAVAPEAFEQL